MIFFLTLWWCVEQEGEEGLLDGDPREEEVAEPAGGRRGHQ